MFTGLTSLYLIIPTGSCQKALRLPVVFKANGDSLRSSCLVGGSPSVDSVSTAG